MSGKIASLTKEIDCCASTESILKVNDFGLRNCFEKINFEFESF